MVLPSPRRAFELTRSSPERYAFGRVDNVGLHVWFAPADLEAARALGEVSEEVLQGYAQGASGIHWLFAGVQLPDAPARREFAALLGRIGPRIGDVGVVLNADGFWASAARSMFTGLRIASGGTSGFRVQRTLDEILEWLPEAHARRTGVRVNPQAIRDGFEYMLRLGVRSP